MSFLRRLLGIPDIKELEATKNVQGLIRALGYKRGWRAGLEWGQDTLGRLIEPLRNQGHWQGWLVRFDARKALARIGTPALELLIAALKDEDSDVRGQAAEALGEIRDERAVEPLIATLKDKHGDSLVRWHAAEALGQIGDGRAVGPLIAALDEDGFIREYAAKALGEIGDMRAVEPLIAVLKDKDKDLRQHAAKALGKIGDARAAEPLIAGLKDEDQSVRYAISDSLEKIGAQAVEPLVASLKEKDFSTQFAITGVLEKIGAPAVEPLITVLKDENSDVRQVAAQTLDRLGWQPDTSETGARYWVGRQLWDKCVTLGAVAVEPLIAVLKDESLLVKVNAAEALGKIGDARAAEPLVAILKDESSTVRAAAIRALSEIGALAVEPLCTALRSENSAIRLAAAEALDALKWKPDRSATGTAYWIAKQVWPNCVEIGAPAVEPLCAVLKHKDSHIRRAAAGALGKIGDARATEPLINMMKEKNSDVRRAAAEALGKIGSAQAVEPLVAILKDQDLEVVNSTAALLDKLGWQPDTSEAGARYWIAKQEWDRCIQIGVPAVEPLIVALKEWASKDAAISLVKMYQSGKLDQAQQLRILDQRQIITQHTDVSGRHQDHGEHSDSTWYDFTSNSEGHSDHYGGPHTDVKGRHTDQGLNVAFPI